MKQLRYSHARVISLAEVAYAWLYRIIVRAVATLPARRLRGRRARRHLTVGLVIFVLVIESVLLYVLAELIGLSLSLMELWAELARKHLELTLDTTV